jgi:hypothetical protein
MQDENGLVCSIAQERHRGSALWRNMWTILLWLLGASITVFLVLAVVFLLREEWLPAAVVTIGSIADGVGMKWVTDRRAEAVREEKEMYLDVENACRGMGQQERLAHR